MQTMDKKKIDHLKLKHTKQLSFFEGYAQKKSWKSFGPVNHFDWFSFPIKQRSSFGLKYSVNDNEIKELKKDENFMKNYLRCFELMCLSWGWSIKEEKFIEKRDLSQTYHKYDIRLRKMGQSLLQFGETKYYKSINKFVKIYSKQNNYQFNTQTQMRYGCKSEWPFQK